MVRVLATQLQLHKFQLSQCLALMLVAFWCPQRPLETRTRCLENNVSNVVPELGALETLAKLVDRFGPNCVHICSKVIFALFFVDFG